MRVGGTPGSGGGRCRVTHALFLPERLAANVRGGNLKTALARRALAR